MAKLKQPLTEEPFDATLSTLGISRRQSAQWQKLAALPRDVFELALEFGTFPRGVPTTVDVLRIGTEIQKRRLLKAASLAQLELDFVEVKHRRAQHEPIARK